MTARPAAGPRSAARATPGDETPLATVTSLFDEAAELLRIDPDEYAILRQPDREMTVAVPVRLDDGKLAIFEGWRVQHNMGLGPYCGPLWLDDRLALDDLRAQAAWMTWKCALLGIPFGGAAGNIAIDRDRFSQCEIERAVRRYVANLFDVIGPDRDVFTPEKARDEVIMGWIMDTVSMHRRTTTNAIVTGKPNVLGGTHHHEDAAAQGMRIVLGLARQRFELGSERTGPSVIVQGIGAVGGNLARLLALDDWRVIGLADKDSALYSAGGLDVEALLEQRDASGSLAGARGDFERLSDPELLSRPCDVLALCALPGAVNSQNCDSVRAKLIVEGQHGAVSAGADLSLRERRIHVVPDILARGGDTLAGYFEWVQNRTGFSWQQGDVLRRMQRFLGEAWTDVVALHESRVDSLRTAAHMVAVSRVAAANKMRGLYA